MENEQTLKNIFTTTLGHFVSGITSDNIVVTEHEFTPTPDDYAAYTQWDGIGGLSMEHGVTTTIAFTDVSQDGLEPDLVTALADAIEDITEHRASFSPSDIQPMASLQTLTDRITNPAALQKAINKRLGQPKPR